MFIRFAQERFHRFNLLERSLATGVTCLRSDSTFMKGLFSKEPIRRKRVKHGRYILIALSNETRGHRPPTAPYSRKIISSSCCAFPNESR
jgi:hypothetical protein